MKKKVLKKRVWESKIILTLGEMLVSKFLFGVCDVAAATSGDQQDRNNIGQSLGKTLPVCVCVSLSLFLFFCVFSSRTHSPLVYLIYSPRASQKKNQGDKNESKRMRARRSFTCTTCPLFSLTYSPRVHYLTSNPALLSHHSTSSLVLSLSLSRAPMLSTEITDLSRTEKKNKTNF